jgi:hypothetical protein
MADDMGEVAGELVVCGGGVMQMRGERRCVKETTAKAVLGPMVNGLGLQFLTVTWSSELVGEMVGMGVMDSERGEEELG